MRSELVEAESLVDAGATYPALPRDMVEGRRVKMPELIIGSGTMDKYGITLDLKEGVKLTGAVLLL